MFPGTEREPASVRLAKELLGFPGTLRKAVNRFWEYIAYTLRPIDTTQFEGHERSFEDWVNSGLISDSEHVAAGYPPSPPLTPFGMSFYPKSSPDVSEESK